MSTDIHGWVEVRVNERWHGVIKIDWIVKRNYDLFGCLFGEKLINFEPVVPYGPAPEDISYEVMADGEFSHIGSEQSLTYKEFKNINWDEESTEFVPNEYVKDGPDFIKSINIDCGGKLSDSEYDKLNQEKVLEKDEHIYKLEKIKRKECLTPDWRRLFEFMREIAEEAGDENVRLVVWFDH